MTIYNWRRKGIYPRLLAWRWAVIRADRRWYISEFVWDSWEKKRRKGSARLPVVSRMPQEETSPDKRKGFLFIGRWVPKKRNSCFAESIRQTRSGSSRMAANNAWGRPLAERSFAYDSEKRIQGVQMPGFVSESERHRYTQEAKWMVTPSHTNEDLGLTPLEARTVGVPCIASTDGGLKETAGTHALFCNPGDTDSLLHCLRVAVKMKETEYAEKVNLTKKDLKIMLGL